jgi:hypothetical protein
MDFFEAMNLMKSGKKVRITTWKEESYIGISEEEKRVFGKRVTIYTPIRENLSVMEQPVSFVAMLQSNWEEFVD